MVLAASRYLRDDYEYEAQAAEAKQNIINKKHKLRSKAESAGMLQTHLVDGLAVVIEAPWQAAISLGKPHAGVYPRIGQCA